MNLAKYSIENRLVTWMIVILFSFGGWISYEKLGRLEDPEFTIKQAVIMTRYPGASPVEVEQEVTDKIETAVQQMGQLDKVTSISRAGLSLVYVEIKEKYDQHTLPQVWDELRSKIDNIRLTLPSGVMGPVVNDDYGDVYGVFYAITGEGFSFKELEDFSSFLKREFLTAQDVSGVEILGIQDEAIYVEIPDRVLSRFSITQKQIFQTLLGYDVIASAGDIRMGEEYIRLHLSGNFESVEEIQGLQIQGSGGKLIRLGDIASVYRGYQEPSRMKMRFNKKPALGLGISTVSGGNVVTMGDVITKKLESLKSRIPYGMKVEAISHQGDSVREAVDGFVTNLVQALMIVIVVLLMFMGVRSGLLIGAILLLTVASTFVFMDIFSIQLQRISLGALIIALGMLVDNAIVVTEGILVQIQTGVSSLKASERTVRETASPLLGATVIAVLAFSGIGLSPDSVGEFCRSLFYVIMISLIMSWVFAVTVTPLFCYLFLKPGNVNQKDLYTNSFFTGFKRFLYISVRYKFLTILFAILLFFLSIYGFSYIPDSFFPNSTRPQFMVNLWLPEGGHIDVSEAQAEVIEDWFLKQTEVKSVSTFVGAGALRFLLVYRPESQNSSYAQILVTVQDHQNIAQLINRFENWAKTLSPDLLVDVQSFVLGPGGGGKIAARISGPDASILRKYADIFKQVMQSEPDTKAVRTDWGGMVKVLRPDFDEMEARQLGISRQDVSEAMRWSLNGVTAAMYREENSLIPMISRPPQAERGELVNLRETRVWSPVTGKYISVDQLVNQWSLKAEDPVIHRRNRVRTVKIQCDPIRGVASRIFARLRPKLESVILPDGYTMEWAGEFEDSSKAKRNLGKALPLGFLAMVVSVVLLFKRLKLTLIILLTLPLALIGVVAGLLPVQQPFDFMSLLGFLSLSGMLIKNSIVLIEQIQIEMDMGMEPFEALIQATVSRIRPVSMAAFTTILGMIPLIYDSFFRGMAITIMGGLGFATVLTLVVVPCLYAIFYDVRQKDVKKL